MSRTRQKSSSRNKQANSLATGDANFHIEQDTGAGPGRFIFHSPLGSQAVVARETRNSGDCLFHGFGPQVQDNYTDTDESALVLRELAIAEIRANRDRYNADLQNRANQNGRTVEEQLNQMSTSRGTFEGDTMALALGRVFEYVTSTVACNY